MYGYGKNSNTRVQGCSIYSFNLFNYFQVSMDTSILHWKNISKYNYCEPSIIRNQKPYFINMKCLYINLNIFDLFYNYPPTHYLSRPQKTTSYD